MFNYEIIKRTNFIFLLFVLAIILGYFYLTRDENADSSYYSDLDDEYVVSYGLGGRQSTLSQDAAKRRISSTADLVVKVLKFQNFTLLDDLIHPEFGVRLSPYQYIMSSDLILTSKQFRDSFANNRILTFGYDINLQPIQMPFQSYYKKYIYSQDYVNADQISYNDLSSRNSTIDNTFSYYPRAIIVEYRIFSGLDKVSGSDWTYLRLVFEEYKNKWYLSGIINISGFRLGDE